MAFNAAYSMDHNGRGRKTANIDILIMRSKRRNIPCVRELNAYFK
jgi:hypothetical protein